MVCMTRRSIHKQSGHMQTQTQISNQTQTHTRRCKTKQHKPHTHPPSHMHTDARTREKAHTQRFASLLMYSCRPAMFMLSIRFTPTLTPRFIIVRRGVPCRVCRVRQETCVHALASACKTVMSPLASVASGLQWQVADLVCDFAGQSYGSRFLGAPCGIGFATVWMWRSFHRPPR
jgi:hypothetical protein